MQDKNFRKFVLSIIIVTIGFTAIFIGIYLLNSPVEEEEQGSEPAKTTESSLTDFTLDYQKFINEDINDNIKFNVEAAFDEKQVFSLEDENNSHSQNSLDKSLNVDGKNHQTGSSGHMEESRNEVVEIIIPAGSSGRNVAHIFEESGLVEDGEFIKLLLLFDFADRIKAGRYEFFSDAGIINILDKILIER